MGYTLNADYRARKNPHPAPKNRVGDFFSCSYEQGVSYAPATPVNTGENQIHGYENASGIPHYRARYYDPGLGRFISRDPIEIDSGDFNFYRYVENQPGFYVDPSGLSPAVDYNKISSKVSVFQKKALECIADISTGLVAEATLYVIALNIDTKIPGNADLYVGETTREFDVRLSEHDRAGRRAIGTVSLYLFPKMMLNEENL